MMSHTEIRKGPVSIPGPGTEKKNIGVFGIRTNTGVPVTQPPRVVYQDEEISSHNINVQKKKAFNRMGLAVRNHKPHPRASTNLQLVAKMQEKHSSYNKLPASVYSINKLQ
jgi:hypothetical protein